MKHINPDIIATIYMYDDDEQNKQPKRKGLPAQQYGCPVFFDNEDSGFDCRLLLDQINKSVAPGETVSGVPIKFLNFDLVKSKLKVGKPFKLWEMGIFGEGEITEVL